MTWLVAVLGLAFLVFIHELGHFGASLALGMRPRRFYVGFPPAIWKIERNGIEYGLGAIPLGGFVKIPGMHRPAGADVDPAFGRAREEAPGLTAPIERLRQSLAAGDEPAARDALDVLESLVEQKELSPGARRAAEKGLQDIRDALGPDAYWRAKTWKRVAVILAGPLANVVLAVVLFVVLLLSVPEGITEVAPNSPAAKAGIQAGDRVLTIDGRQVAASEIGPAIRSSEGRPLTFVVDRDGRTVVLGPITAERTEGQYRIGVGISERHSAGGAIVESFRITWRVTENIVASIARLVTPDGRENISSAVGIVQASSAAAKQGTNSYLTVLALISLSLALLNLLPLLPLDGGHIVFAVVEGVRKRTVKREIYERVSMVGIGLVLLLFFIGLSNDVNRQS